MGFNTSLGLGGSYALTGSPSQTVSDNNYLDLANTANQGWAQQYLPELYEQEIERYGNRTINGFLAMVGAEMPMMSDQVVWSEQNRLHIAYKHKAGGNETCVITTVSSGLITLGSDYTNSVRVGATVIVTDAATGLKTNVCRVSATDSSANTFNVKPYKTATLSADLNNSDGVNVFVFGSEFAKGSASMVGELKPTFTKFDNRPIIIKDHFKISGSDTAQIGWVETIDESGQSGFSWYMKSASETRLRFEDYLEMTMVETVKGVPGSSTADTDMGIAGENFGSEGLFEAIETRGNVFEDLATLSDFDLVLKNLDKQGAIEENILYVNRDLALTFDDMMAGLNANYGGGASFGVFENSADMALNLGFSGLRRGSYDFYKSDWRYLNDATARGGFGDISGVLIPAGVSSVYDENLGRNIKRPFLHVRYRASQTDDRRMKSWVTGSVGGASYIGDDIMEVHYLSERCLVVQAANNFVLLKEA